MTSISKLKHEFLICLEYSRKILADQVNGYQDSERIFKGAALTLYYVEKYAQMIGYKMQPIDMERAVYVGGLIDPYDSIIDQVTIDEALVSCARFFKVLNTGEFTPVNKRENVFVDLYSTLTQILPPKKYENIYTLLATMHMVESVAILQKKGAAHIIGIPDKEYTSPLSNNLLRQVMEMKGGLSLLLFSGLIDNNIQLEPGFNQYELGSEMALKRRIRAYICEGKPLFELQTSISELVYSMGNYIQAMDDLRDVTEDYTRDIETYTQRVGTVKSLLTAKNFRKQIVDQTSRLFSKEQGNIFLMYADFYFARTIGIAVKRDVAKYASYILKMGRIVALPFQFIYNSLAWTQPRYSSENNHVRKYS